MMNGNGFETQSPELKLTRVFREATLFTNKIEESSREGPTGYLRDYIIYNAI